MHTSGDCNASLEGRLTNSRTFVTNYHVELPVKCLSNTLDRESHDDENQ